jgi:hypothetical protein
MNLPTVVSREMARRPQGSVGQGEGGDPGAGIRFLRSPRRSSLAKSASSSSVIAGLGHVQPRAYVHDG